MMGLLLLLSHCLAGPSLEEPAYCERGPQAGAFAVPLDHELAAALAKAVLEPEQWRDLLAVHLGEPREDIPAMLGSYRLVDETLYFHPRLPFLDGRTYCALWRVDRARALAGLADKPQMPQRTCFTPPSVAHQPPTVSAVSPATTTVPANLLRLYIHFSQPMARERAYSGIRLLDADDQPVPMPFVIVPQELWDPAGLRLTLLFDPGRIKRGVGPNLELGPPLVEGRRYTLEIAGRPDATGQAMTEPYRHSFTVGPADRSSPDPKSWRMLVPPANTRDPLRVLFDAPLDRALAERCLAVRGPEGFLHGRVALDAEVMIWTFVPDSTWRAAAYTLIVAADLEDPCGNRPGRPFDVPMGDAHFTAHGTELPFSVTDPAAEVHP